MPPATTARRPKGGPFPSRQDTNEGTTTPKSTYFKLLPFVLHGTQPVLSRYQGWEELVVLDEFLNEKTERWRSQGTSSNVRLPNPPAWNRLRKWCAATSRSSVPSTCFAPALPRLPQHRQEIEPLRQKSTSNVATGQHHLLEAWGWDRPGVARVAASVPVFWAILRRRCSMSSVGPSRPHAFT